MAKGAYIGINTNFPASDSLGAKSVGSIVKLNENGSPIEYIIIHQGNPEIFMYDASCNGTWLLRKDIYIEKVFDSTNNSYANSDVHSYLNSTFLNLFDSNVKSAVKQVKIPYYKGTGNLGDMQFKENGLSTKIFLLSGHEAGWKGGALDAVDGSLLDYFTGLGVTDSKRIAKYNGTTYMWWLRSPSTNNTSNVWMVSKTGSYSTLPYGSASTGVRPVFIMPFDLKVDSNNLITGEITPPIVKGIAHKIKKGYIGVGGKARRIKKAYIGIGGKARPCWSGGELAYYGTVTALSQSRMDLASTVVGGYAIFAGGKSGSAVSTRKGNVDAYDASLTRSILTEMLARYLHSAATAGNVAIFAGGSTANASDEKSAIAYNSSLTQLSCPSMSSSRGTAGATSVGGKALFAGGVGGSTYRNTVDVYDESLTRSSATNLSLSRANIAATTINDNALFAGGRIKKSNNISCSAVVNSYNTSLTMTTIASLNARRYNMGATTVGNYAIFAGGWLPDATDAIFTSADVDVYERSLTRVGTTKLSLNRHCPAATTVEDYALIAGGVNDNKGTTVVDIFSTSLVLSTTTALSVLKGKAAAETVGNYALIAGGQTGGTGTSTDVVDVYIVA